MYSATRLYLDGYTDGDPLTWPRDVLTLVPTRAALIESLATGPYGECVYRAEHDVVDHQVLAVEFDNGVSETFTLAAFTPMEQRKTRIFGTLGFLDGDGTRVRHVDFRTGAERILEVPTVATGAAGGGHGGGDAGVMDAFVTAVASGDAAGLTSSAEESLASHLAVFAAERARLTGAVVAVPRAG